jgi:hypothetical protein
VQCRTRDRPTYLSLNKRTVPHAQALWRVNCREISIALIDEVVAYFELSSRTALAYSSVAFCNSALRSFASRASAFLSASRTFCTLFSAALTSSMVDMASPVLVRLPKRSPTVCDVRHSSSRSRWLAKYRDYAHLSLRRWMLRVIGRSFRIYFLTSSCCPSAEENEPRSRDRTLPAIQCETTESCRAFPTLNCKPGNVEKLG